LSAAPSFIVGNWKMNGLSAQLAELRALAEGLARRPATARVGVCPPATLVFEAAGILRGTPVELGAQDCRAEPRGAFTGDLSAEMLADAGATLVILGHSERREGHGETDAIVAAKVQGALRAGLEPIVCVGETQDQRRAGHVVAVVTGQVRASLPHDLANRPFSVAYEPIWAIGSGETPTADEIAEVHDAIRRALAERFGDHGAKVPVLYGGSVKPANAAEVLRTPGVGGALVGGASLAAREFLQIIAAA
jgi:triosephosphate isomerase